LVTTLTKRMSEDLCDYFADVGMKVRYMHSDIQALERMEILRELRSGIFDVLIGINLLREGLDLPEVALVAILDADKEGFLRSARSLIQTTGRAARNVDGKVIMYGDKITPSMRQAIDETSRRRAIQLAHNEAHNITPETIKKAVYASIEATVAEAPANYNASTFAGLNKDERSRLAGEIELEMRKASEALEFERAAQLRDMIRELNLPPKKKRKRR
jgi:excinuclease ABC subunit B